MTRISTTTPRGKYNAKKTWCANTHLHDSKKEASRCDDLELLQKAGIISELRRQVWYHFFVNNIKICAYVTDFVYIDNETQKEVVEDVKGVRTHEYVIKRKLMLALYNISIKET